MLPSLRCIIYRVTYPYHKTPAHGSKGTALVSRKREGRRKRWWGAGTTWLHMTIAQTRHSDMNRLVKKCMVPAPVHREKTGRLKVNLAHAPTHPPRARLRARTLDPHKQSTRKSPREKLISGAARNSALPRFPAMSTFSSSNFTAAFKKREFLYVFLNPRGTVIRRLRPKHL